MFWLLVFLFMVFGFAGFENRKTSRVPTSLHWITRQLSPGTHQKALCGPSTLLGLRPAGTVMHLTSTLLNFTSNIEPSPVSIQPD